MGDGALVETHVAYRIREKSQSVGPIKDGGNRPFSEGRRAALGSCTSKTPWLSFFPGASATLMEEKATAHYTLPMVKPSV